VSLPLSQIVDKVTAGKTKKEAFYALFTSPVYQAMEDNSITSANPPGGLPKVERRRRNAQLLINAVTAYYDMLTQDELERRAASGTSAAAKQWSDAKTELADQVFKRSIERVRVTAPLLNQGQGEHNRSAPVQPSPCRLATPSSPATGPPRPTRSRSHTY
jgi:hypothetical protein